MSVADVHGRATRSGRPTRSRRATRALAAGAGLALVLGGCTVGEEPTAPDPVVTTTAEPRPGETSTGPGPGPTQTTPRPPPTTVVPPDQQPPGDLSDAEQLIDTEGVTDADVGYPRLPVAEGVDDYGLDAPTQDQCDEPDATDESRLARVQHWWQSDGGPDGSEPVVVVSSEIVLYESGTAADAVAALAAAPERCPSRELDDGGTLSYAPGEVPRGAAAGSVALRGTRETADGVVDSMLVAQSVGDVVGYVYVLGVGPSVLTESARLAAIMQARLTALAPQLDPGLPG